jgi:hypothetical protein
LSKGTPYSNFPQICNEVLNMNKSIRFVGIANNLGTLLSSSYREKLIPLLTKEETQHYALQAVLRAEIREDFMSKLGSLKHSIGTYGKLIRATIPVTTKDNHVTKFFLLLSFDVDTDVKDFIETKLLPFIDKNKGLFNSDTSRQV